MQRQCQPKMDLF